MKIFSILALYFDSMDLSCTHNLLPTIFFYLIEVHIDLYFEKIMHFLCLHSYYFSQSVTLFISDSLL